jgi:hypothetical protein
MESPGNIYRKEVAQSQSLAALVACDQSYLHSANGKKVKAGDPLAVLPDGFGASTNEKIYTDSPAFAIPSGYTVAAVIERPEVGAKAVIYRNPTTNETMVAFGGTDGVNAQDYVANTQSYGWSQWNKLNTSNGPKDLGIVEWLQENGVGTVGNCKPGANESRWWRDGEFEGNAPERRAA